MATSIPPTEALRMAVGQPEEIWEATLAAFTPDELLVACATLEAESEAELELHKKVVARIREQQDAKRRQLERNIERFKAPLLDIVKSKVGARKDKRYIDVPGLPRLQLRRVAANATIEDEDVFIAGLGADLHAKIVQTKEYVADLKAAKKHVLEAHEARHVVPGATVREAYDSLSIGGDVEG